MTAIAQPLPAPLAPARPPLLAPLATLALRRLQLSVRTPRELLVPRSSGSCPRACRTARS